MILRGIMKGRDFKLWLAKYGFYSVLTGPTPSAIALFGVSRATFYRRLDDNAVLEPSYVNQCELIDRLTDEERVDYFASRDINLNIQVKQ
ncbi:hypothetical protein [Aeromonas veronii]|uniref:hypothetical protein n=2 Tax=Aeromonas veronii TaxID=654 RepID=UPI0018830DA5|nr:hypothetical protein [Aeromonas veronii]MBE8745258.1 hypothetical protein [Aeromonas veronii]